MIISGKNGKRAMDFHLIISQKKIIPNALPVTPQYCPILNIWDIHNINRNLTQKELFCLLNVIIWLVVNKCIFLRALFANASLYITIKTNIIILFKSLQKTTPSCLSLNKAAAIFFTTIICIIFLDFIRGCAAAVAFNDSLLTEITVIDVKKSH